MRNLISPPPSTRLCTHLVLRGLSWEYTAKLTVLCVSVHRERRTGSAGHVRPSTHPPTHPPQPLFSFCYTADLHWQRSQPLSLNLFQPAAPPLSQLGQWWRGGGGVDLITLHLTLTKFFSSALTNSILGSCFYYFF